MMEQHLKPSLKSTIYSALSFTFSDKKLHSYWTAGYYKHLHWSSFWDYMDDYFSAGADNEVEDGLCNVVFPDPYPP